MAKEGCRLTSFYAAPVCSPSRAPRMTGCYPKRVLPIPGVLWPGNDVGLAPGEVTVAEVLKAQGHATAIVGKWHLGDQPDFLPNRQGFDLSFGLPARTVEANAATASLVGSGLGLLVDRRFPLQHALQGWCPPVPIFRHLGFRTAREID
jgi:arylsulfatase A-like enzyme